MFDDVRFVVKYALEVFHLYTQQRTDTAWQRADIPDVRDRRYKIDVSHTDTAYFL